MLIEQNHAAFSPKATRLLIDLAGQCQEGLLETCLGACTSDLEVMKSQFYFLQQFQRINIQTCPDRQFIPTHQLARMRLQKYLDPTFSDTVLDSVKYHYYNFSEELNLVNPCLSLVQRGNIKVS